MRLNAESLTRGDRVLLAGLVLLLGFAATLIHAGRAAARAEPALERNRALTAGLALTDLALFTEARYTRHRSQAERHAAFQDHPGALEHFPTGSLVGPPPYRVPYADAPLDSEAAVSR